MSTGENYAYQIQIAHFDLITDQPGVLGGQGKGPALMTITWQS